MATTYTAVVQRSGDWWIGWVEEVPGVNSQGETREELLDNLRDALEEALEMNRADARAAATGAFEEVSLAPCSGFPSHDDLVPKTRIRSASKMPNDRIPPPGESPLDPYMKEIDSIAFALNKVRVNIHWIEEHHASFEAARESDPEKAERELRCLEHSARDARESMGRLVELLMTGNTIDLSKKLPRDLERWRNQHMT